jgi:hypothetical protein
MRLHAEQGSGADAQKPPLRSRFRAELTAGDMQTSHKGLGISASEWAVFMQHATASLEKFAVPEAERDEVLTFLTSLQGDIVLITRVVVPPSVHAAEAALTIQPGPPSLLLPAVQPG